MRGMNDSFICLVGIEVEDMSFVVIDPDHGVVMRGHLASFGFRRNAAKTPVMGEHCRSRTTGSERRWPPA
jgi:hypothetical protein